MTRYTSRTTELGPRVGTTFRLPKALLATLDETLEKGIPDVRTRTDAVEDALVKWLMVEQADGT